MSITKVTLPKDTPVLLANSADVVSLQNLSSRPINITTTSTATPTPNITTVDSMRIRPTGDYENPEKGCPNCGRNRVMVGEDKKHRCEKCAWCIEDKEIDGAFSDYLFRGY